jgi:DNA topoisomerase 2-associated protein PAT1
MHSEGAAKEAAKLGREALGNAAHVCYTCFHHILDYIVTFLPQTDGLVRKDPLTHRQILAILENLYDVVLKVEQLRRDQPSESDVEAFQTW